MPGLREIRTEKKLSQLQLASRAGVSLATIQKLEVAPRVERRTAEKIAAALGVSVDEVDELRMMVKENDDGGDGA